MQVSTDILTRPIMRYSLTIFALALLSVLPALSRSGTIYVPADKPTIQEAINLAVSGDTVLVASGTYSGALNTNLDFFGKNIVLLSQSGAATTIIDCERVEFRRGVYLHSGENSNAKIIGFTITRGVHRGAGIYCVGASPVVENCILSYHYSYHGGAAIRCDSGAALTLRNSTVKFNYSGLLEKAQKRDGDKEKSSSVAVAHGKGGAICVDSGSSAVIRSTLFQYNTCDEMGGALYVRFGNLTVDSCTFRDNSVFGSSSGGGALFVDSGGSSSIISDCDFTYNHSGEASGGAIYLRNSSPKFRRCIVDSNYCWIGNGGAVSAVLGAGGQFANCSFLDNENQSGFGGAIYSLGASPFFDTCLMVGNHCSPYGLDGGGGAVCADTGSAPQLTHCTIVRNYTTDFLPGAALLSVASSPTLSKSIVAFNGDGGAIIGAATLTCTDMWGNNGGDWIDAIAGQRNLSGNLCAPPRFCDTANSDFSLGSNSRCLAANNSCAVTMGARFVPCANRTEPIHVDNTGNDSAGSGNEAHPFATIQKGLNESLDGDSVVVHSGSYSGSGNNNISTLGKRIVLHGRDGASSTMISIAPSGVGFSDTILPFRLTMDGFTLRGGLRGIDAIADGALVRQCQFDSVATAIHLRSVDSSLFAEVTFAHCDTGVAMPSSDTNALQVTQSTFLNNRVALFAKDTSRNSRACVVDSSLFDSCDVAVDLSALVRWTTIRDGGSATGKRYPSVVELENCSVRGCSANAIGVGLATTFRSSLIENNGDTIASLANPLQVQSLILENSIIRNNAGSIVAGGLAPQLTLSKSLFAQNNGGIVFNQGAVGNLIIDSATIALNSGSVRTSGNAEIMRSVIAWNGDTGIVILPGDSVPTVLCNDVYGNSGARYGGISDLTGIGGNISVDPLFCDTASGLFTVLDTSVCLAPNNSCATRMGAFNAGCAYPVINSIRVDTVGNNMHVLSNSPLIHWSRGDILGGLQTDFEIAIGTDSNWAFSELWNPAPVISPESTLIYAGAPLSDGQSGYIRLRITAGGRVSQWRMIPFRLNTAPTSPSLLRPANDLVVATATPTVWISNGNDNENDTLFYDIQFATDSLFASVALLDSLVPEEVDSTAHVVSSALTENSRYYWRARTSDLFERSPWSPVAPFRINAIDDPPSQVVALWPPDSLGRPVFDMLPLFDWQPSTDPDPGDSVTHYRLELSINPQFTFSYVVDSITASEWEISDSLMFSLAYWWRVRAYDVQGVSSTPSETRNFWTWTLGDINYTHTCNVVDLTYLVNFLFRGGTPIAPRFAGDFNGSCTVNVVDLTYLVNFLFRGGASPQIGCGPAK
jgi:Right handed beta helix region